MWKLGIIGVMALGAVGTGLLTLGQDDLKGNRPVAYQVGHPVTVRTHLYALEIDIVQLEPFGAGGGAIESLGDDLLVATTGGRLALIASNGTVEYLDGTVPMNRSGFESHDLYEDSVQKIHFRVTDILLKHHSPGRFELFVTHHYFTGECTRLRLSATTLLREEGSVPVLSSWRTVFDTESCLTPPYSGHESGGKMLTDGPDHLLTTIGDHGKKGAAQDPDSHLGKLVRIEIQTGEVEVLTLGHRNPQGLARDKDGNLWVTEHGPQGGDELNLLEPGGNYGWDHVSYGVQYGGSILNNRSKVGQHDEFVPPVFAWVPSIAVTSIVVNDARWFPLWKDDLLITSVDGSSNTAGIAHGRSIFRVRRHGKQVQYVEKIEIGVPIQDITYMSDGRLALLQGYGGGRILFVRRSNEYCAEESEWQRNVYALHCESIVDDAATDMPDTGESGRTDSLDTGDPTAATPSAVQLFGRHCGSCHRLNDEKHDAGPHLVGVIGRRAGEVDGYYNFSPALRSLDLVWTRDNLERFLVDPKRFAPGTSMQASDVTEAEARAIVDFISGDKAHVDNADEY